MAYGSFIVIGKGNSDWNNSAPHGAGRLFSRTKAKEILTMEAYKQSMKGIHSICISTGTLDEIAAIVKSAPASKLNPKMEMEGIVIRPFRELKNAKNERIIYKVKVADLLGRNARKL